MPVLLNKGLNSNEDQDTSKFLFLVKNTPNNTNKTKDGKIMSLCVF